MAEDPGTCYSGGVDCYYIIKLYDRDSYNVNGSGGTHGSVFHGETGYPPLDKS